MGIPLSLSFDSPYSLDGMIWFFIGIPLLVVAIVFLIVAVRKATRKAKEEYDASLTRLRLDPNNAILREQTLRLGRVYADKTRNGQGVALFDEMAIKNDIDAATAGAARVTNHSQPPDVPSYPVTSMSRPGIEVRLEKLDDLYSKGLISADDHQRRKQAILDEI